MLLENVVPYHTAPVTPSVWVSIIGRYLVSVRSCVRVSCSCAVLLPFFASVFAYFLSFHFISSFWFCRVCDVFVSCSDLLNIFLVYPVWKKNPLYSCVCHRSVAPQADATVPYGESIEEVMLKVCWVQRRGKKNEKEGRETRKRRKTNEMAQQHGAMMITSYRTYYMIRMQTSSTVINCTQTYIPHSWLICWLIDWLSRFERWIYVCWIQNKSTPRKVKL